MNDILWGRKKVEHDVSQLKAEKREMLFWVKELKVGDILSKEGIRPDPKEVSVIEITPRSQCMMTS